MDDGALGVNAAFEGKTEAKVSGDDQTVISGSDGCQSILALGTAVANHDARVGGLSDSRRHTAKLNTCILFSLKIITHDNKKGIK